ncbi:hypothetical protein JHW43_005572 [Diplocarpon mali]|nr:hypothetical protein JHW43_005572 [Diplocarpon mali]
MEPSFPITPAPLCYLASCRAQATRKNVYDGNANGHRGRPYYYCDQHHARKFVTFDDSTGVAPGNPTCRCGYISRRGLTNGPPKKEFFKCAVGACRGPRRQAAVETSTVRGFGREASPSTKLWSRDAAPPTETGSRQSSPLPKSGMTSSVHGTGSLIEQVPSQRESNSGVSDITISSRGILRPSPVRDLSPPHLVALYGVMDSARINTDSSLEIDAQPARARPSILSAKRRCGCSCDGTSSGENAGNRQPKSNPEMREEEDTLGGPPPILGRAHAPPAAVDAILDIAGLVDEMVKLTRGVRPILDILIRRISERTDATGPAGPTETWQFLNRRKYLDAAFN